jgi:diacylglycerol kinase family enzyme
MNKTSWIAIVNRAAGGGKTEKDWPVISHLLDKHGIRYEPHFTNRRLHASVIAGI